MKWSQRCRALLLRVEKLAGEVFYPQAASCQICGEKRLVHEKYALCDECLKALEKLHVPATACQRCLFPIKGKAGCIMCRTGRMKAIDRSHAPFCYRLQARKLVHELKFEQNASFMDYLAEQMVSSVGEETYDALVPVPLNQRRLYDRGQNQAALLARAMAERMGIPVLDALSRSGYQKPQSETPLAERRKNIQGCFHIQKPVDGMRLLLIDDVRTTGSTAQECAKVLKSAGAAWIGLCTIAVVFRNPKKVKNTTTPQKRFRRK